MEISAKSLLFWEEDLILSIPDLVLTISEHSLSSFNYAQNKHKPTV